MSTIERPATDPYLAAVAAALADLSQAERQELLDDLAEHLAELADEDGEVVDRLGPPEDYAAELLASAGITTQEAAASAEPEPLAERTRRAVEAASRSEAARAVRAFLPELRPGWWVLRGWGGVAVLALVAGGAVFPLPDPVANGFVAVLLLAGAVVGSVHVGRTGGRIDRLLTVVGAVGVAFALAQGGPRTEYVYDGVGQSMPGALIGPEGRYIANIWPFDGAGNPIDGVFLVDQDGNPVTVGRHDTTGPVVDGLFPQAQTEVEYDPTTGAQREVPVTAPAVVVPQLPGGSSSTTATTVGAAPTTAAVPPPAATIPPEVTTPPDATALPG